MTPPSISVAAIPDEDERSDLDDAVDFLVDHFADGEPRASREVKLAAKRRGITARTLQRALRPAGLEAVRVGMPSVSHWQPAQSRQADEQAPLWRDCESPPPIGDSAHSERQSRQDHDPGATGASAPRNALLADVYDWDDEALG